MLHDPQMLRDSTSPSLLGGVGAASAFELKFLLDAATAAGVENWAARHLALDPHADPALDNAYRIHSLYLDTPGLDVYHRSPKFRRRKYRVRRYGAQDGVFVERKTKTGERVRKRRAAIADAEIDFLRAAAVDPAWPGAWFRNLVATRRLQPACLVTYDRVAHVGHDADGPLRLTLDRRIVAAPATAWRVAPATDGIPLLPEHVVLELKYRGFLPHLFKRLIEEFGLNPRPASKYRLAVEAFSPRRDDCIPFGTPAAPAPRYGESA